MKFLLPISLFFLGSACAFIPFLLAKDIPPDPPVVLLGIVFAPMVLGVIMIGFGIVFAYKCYSEK